MQCHHKLPKQKGGTDEYDNLIWVSGNAHKLIHATQADTIARYLQQLNLDLSADRQAI
ncbi:MAG: HNH endonuclease [Firmicutes bacterium]|nr:HNH endonuclease [Bacillota bacterium]